MSHPDLRELVREALNNAKENECTFEGMSDLEVAEDMLEFDASFEGIEDAEVLVPFVAEFRA